MLKDLSGELKNLGGGRGGGGAEGLIHGAEGLCGLLKDSFGVLNNFLGGEGFFSGAEKIVVVLEDFCRGELNNFFVDMKDFGGS